NIPEGNMFFGIPFPGDFVLAPDGTITHKHFLPNYQTRPTAAGILLNDFDETSGGPVVTIAADDVQATMSLSNDETAPGTELGVAVTIVIAPGWHLYGTPLPENYTATTVTFSDEFVSDQALSLPPPTPLEFKALGETLPVYEKTIQAKGTILISGRAKLGDYKLAGTLKFQACNESVCKIPQAVPFELPLRIRAMTPGLK